MSQIPEQNPIDAETLARAMAEPPLAGLRAGNAAYFIVAGARIIHASPAAQALFRTKDLDALTERLFKGSEPGARRLVDLARSLIPATPTRLERLRFFFGRATHTVTFACRRLAGPPPLFVAAALDAPAALLSPTSAEAATVKATDNVDTSPAAAPPLPAEPPIPITAVPTPAEAPRAAGTVRFLWQTDRERRFVKLTGALCEAMGCQTADLIGQDFIAVAERFGVDRIEDLRAAFTRHETWSGLRVSWPINGTQDAAPVTLGGLPIFDEEHAFNGFSGFGVINLDKIVTRPAPAEPIADTQLKENENNVATEETATVSAFSDDEHDALDDAREKMFAPPHPEPDYLNYAPNVVPLRDWQRDRQSANGQADASSPADATPTETVPVDTSVAPPSVEAAPIETPELAAMETIASEPPNAGGSAPSIPEPDNDNLIALSASERQAFREIARSIVADIERGEKPANVLPAVTQAVEGINAASPPPSAADESNKDEIDGATAQKIAQEIATEATPVAKSAETTPHPSVDATPAQASVEQMREIAAALGVAGPIAKPAAEAPPSPVEIMPANAAAIFDRLNMGILVMLGGVPTFANRHLLDLLGFSDIDAFHDWGGPDRMIHGQALDEHGADGTPMQVETHSGTLVKLNGRMQKTEWNGQPATLMTFRAVEAQNAEAKHVDVKHVDVKPMAATPEPLPIKPESETRSQDAEIRELHAILDTATDGVAILDGAGNILSLNRSAEALFGYERGEVAGQAFTTLFAKDSHKAALDYLEGLKSHGVRSVLNDGREVIGRARMGGQIPIFMTIGRIGSETSEKFCAVMRDMSDWKNAERELKDARREAEQASALKSDFLAKISHEIRTPLNAILGFAEVIIDERFGPVGNDRYKEYLRDIHASGTHVMSLVNDLLDLSKIEAGKLDLNFGAVDANKIVNECVSIMQPQSVRERVIMRLALAPHLPNIVADERALRQIVLNILSNAVKFNQPGGQVIVSTALTDSGQAVVRVRDTGIGMSEKDLEIALEPFRQIQTSRQTTGTGLGLPLTKALVEANRAAFSIKSKPGDGTLVEVTFPSTRVLAE